MYFPPPPVFAPVDLQAGRGEAARIGGEEEPMRRPAELAAEKEHDSAAQGMDVGAAQESGADDDEGGGTAGDRMVITRTDDDDEQEAEGGGGEDA